VVEEIAIFSDHVNDEFAMPSIPLLISMIHRSTNAHVLQRLSFHTSNIYLDKLISLLQLTPRLIFLDISSPIINSTGLLCLIDVDSTGDSKPLTPLLRTLVITNTCSVLNDMNYFDLAIDMNLLAHAQCEEANQLLLLPRGVWEKSGGHTLGGEGGASEWTMAADFTEEYALAAEMSETEALEPRNLAEAKSRPDWPLWTVGESY